MYIKFNDSDNKYEIDVIYNYGDIIVIQGDNIPDNFSGLKLYTIDDDICTDYSEFIYKFNVNTEFNNVLMLSKNSEIFESEKYPIDNYYVEVTENDIINMIKSQKDNLVSKSKEMLKTFLKNNPIKSYAHGGIEGIYSVTEEKQTLMSNQYMTYQIEKQVNPDAKLTWNESGKECEIWTEEEFLQLVMEVKAYVYPLVSYQQTLETQIMNCTTIEELNNIVIDYSSVVSK